MMVWKHCRDCPSDSGSDSSSGSGSGRDSSLSDSSAESGTDPISTLDATDCIQCRFGIVGRTYTVDFSASIVATTPCPNAYAGPATVRAVGTLGTAWQSDETALIIHPEGDFGICTPSFAADVRYELTCQPFLQVYRWRFRVNYTIYNGSQYSNRSITYQKATDDELGMDCLDFQLPLSSEPFDGPHLNVPGSVQVAAI